jgi:anti-anti-sigma factor
MADKRIEFEQKFEPATGVVEIRVLASEVVDEQAIQRLGDEVAALAGQAGVKKLLLDLRDVRFLSSRGLSAVLLLHRKLNASDATLIVLVERPEILELFGLTHLDQILNVARNEKDLKDKFNIGS